MFNRALPLCGLVVVSALSFNVQSVAADTLDTAHSTLCMKMRQCGDVIRTDPEPNDGLARLFEESRESFCSSPESLFGDSGVDAKGRQLARACYQSVALQGCDELVGMDMDTPACSAFFSHINGG